MPELSPAEFADYTVGKPGIDFDPDHPEWDPDHLFAERTAVLHRGTSWRALRPTQGEEPGVVADAWTVLAQGGDTGTIDEAVQAATEAGAAQVALAAEQAGSAATQAASALTSAQQAAQDRAAAEHAALTLGATAYPLRADLPASPASGARAYVYADGNEANLGLWFWSGASWQRDQLNPARQSDVVSAEQRSLAAAASGVVGGRKFARLEDGRNGFAIIDESGSAAAEFDDLGNPEFASMSMFHRVGEGSPPGLTLVDADERRIAGFDGLGNPEFSWSPVFERLGDELPAGDILLVDDEGRPVDLGGGSQQDPDFQDLPRHMPADVPGDTALWRDCAHLAVRGPLDALYTQPRAVWFTNLATLYARYDALVAEYPAYVTRSSLGQDGIGNHIYQYVFTPRAPRVGPPAPGSQLDPQDAALPKIIVTSGVHGSERTAQHGTLIFATRLCKAWRDDPDYRRLRFAAQLVIVPAAVPSGVNLGTRPNHNGVDVNRNANFRWGEAGSPTPPADTYIGPSVKSELETQILTGLPALHPDAIAWIDHHNHAEPQLIWIACGTPAYQPVINQLAAALREDVYRLGIAPEMSPDEQTIWLSKAVAGNLVGEAGLTGLPSFFVEEPALATHPALGGSIIALHRLAEAMVLRSVVAVLNHHISKME
ncbi:M14 family zinc carboxypeptidase [Neotabrizicola sp. VNH66]|uniref:M14 family zinc carboxypeptidase n=1 Tax=Neotabrizicola sp. VNH66 TaxID=3400918 RepID=UPI003BFAC0B9